METGWGLAGWGLVGAVDGRESASVVPPRQSPAISADDLGEPILFSISI